MWCTTGVPVVVFFVQFVQINAILRGKHEVVRAFADDTLLVIEDYVSFVGIIASIFDEYKLILGFIISESTSFQSGLEIA